MKNQLIDLNNVLYEQLERLNDEDLKGEDLDKEIKRSRALTNVANSIINNGALALKAVEFREEYGIKADSQKLLGLGDRSE